MLHHTCAKCGAVLVPLKGHDTTIGFNLQMQPCTGCADQLRAIWQCVKDFAGEPLIKDKEAYDAAVKKMNELLGEDK